MVADVACGAAGYVAAHMAAHAQSSTATRITIDVRNYSFTPGEIRVKNGESVTFALFTTDFVHGFAIPDFNTRVDVIHSKLTELTLTFYEVGRSHLLGDNICGEDHDKMSGFLVVIE